MGQLKDQVIKAWNQVPELSAFKPDVKSSLLKLSIKNEILAPSYAVSIAPVSHKVEVDPLVYFDRENVFSEALSRYLNMGLLQSVDIKATGKLSFKGDKEVAFKSKGSVEYNSTEDDEAKLETKKYVLIAVVSAGIVSILTEALALSNFKKTHDIIWYSYMGFSRLLFNCFSFLQREKIKIEFATAVKAAAAQEEADKQAAAAEAQRLAIAAGVDPVRELAEAAANIANQALNLAQSNSKNIDNLTIVGRKRFSACRRKTNAINSRLNAKLFDLREVARNHQSQISQLRRDAVLAAAAQNDQSE